MNAPTPKQRVTRASSWIVGILAAYFLAGVPLAVASGDPWGALKAGWSVVCPVCLMIAWGTLTRIERDL